jgi:hypothetical protein
MGEVVAVESVSFPPWIRPRSIARWGGVVGYIRQCGVKILRPRRCTRRVRVIGGSSWGCEIASIEGCSVDDAQWVVVRGVGNGVCWAICEAVHAIVSSHRQGPQSEWTEYVGLGGADMTHKRMWNHGGEPRRRFSSTRVGHRGRGGRRRLLDRRGTGECRWSSWCVQTLRSRLLLRFLPTPATRTPRPRRLRAVMVRLHVFGDRFQRSSSSHCRC